MNKSKTIKAFILEPLGPFYGYIPTSLTLYRALLALEKSGLIDLKDGFSIAGIFAYDPKNDLLYLPSDSRILALKDATIDNYKINVPESLYVPFESSMKSYFALVKGKNEYEVRVEYPFLLTLSARINVSRSAFTSYGTGRVAYNRMYLSRFKRAILTDLDKNIIRLLGEFGVGNYKSIGGGAFEIIGEREVEIKPINVQKKLEGYDLEYSPLDFPLNYGIGNVREMRTRIFDGSSRIKIVRYLAGGLIKKDALKDDRPQAFRGSTFPRIKGNDCPRARLIRGFPFLKKRSARAPIIIFQTRGGSSSR